MKSRSLLGSSGMNGIRDSVVLMTVFPDKPRPFGLGRLDPFGLAGDASHTIVLVTRKTAIALRTRRTTFGRCTLIRAGCSLDERRMVDGGIVVVFSLLQRTIAIVTTRDCSLTTNRIYKTRSWWPTFDSRRGRRTSCLLPTLSWPPSCHFFRIRTAERASDL